MRGDDFEIAVGGDQGAARGDHLPAANGWTKLKAPVVAVTVRVTSAQRGCGAGAAPAARPVRTRSAAMASRVADTVSGSQCCPASTRTAAASPGPVKRA